MTIASEFRIGDRVRMSEKAAAMSRGPSTGRVVGLTRNGLYVKVLRDGRKTVGSYHPDFWEPTK